MKSNRYLPLVLAFLFIAPATVFAEAGWEKSKGFYIQSEDGDFNMRIGGRVQVAEEVNKRVETKASRQSTATTADTFTNTFRVRRARIQTTGTMFKKLDWFTILSLATSVTGNPRADLFTGLTYNFHPAFALSMGMVQLPMDRMGEDSSAWYVAVEPPLTATQEDGVKDLTITRSSFGLPFDLGLRVDGDVGDHFSYGIALANGSGYRNFNVNNELSYGARVMVNVLGKVPYKQSDFAWTENPSLAFGVGTGYEDEDAQETVGAITVTNRWLWSSSGDVAFRYRGFAFNSELYYRVVQMNRTTVEDTNGDRKLKDVGYYANAAYFVLPKKLELSLTGSQILREGPDNNAVEFGGGLNWYIHENSVKFQTDYTYFIDYDEIPGLNNAAYHRVRLMFSMFI